MLRILRKENVMNEKVIHIEDMTSAQIKEISDFDWKNNVPPTEKKSCANCRSLIQAVNLWCSNTEAIKARGTRIPGCIKCTYWSPDWKHIDDKWKTPEHGYTATPGLMQMMAKYIFKLFSNARTS